MRLASLLFIPVLAFASFTTDQRGVYDTPGIFVLNENGFPVVRFDNWITGGNPFNSVAIYAGLPIGPREADESMTAPLPFWDRTPTRPTPEMTCCTVVPYTPTPAPSGDTAVPEPGTAGLLMVAIGFLVFWRRWA